jgi:hypothetical protein
MEIMNRYIVDEPVRSKQPKFVVSEETNEQWVTYVSPAKEFLAAATVDIVHCMHSGHEIAILVGTKAHIHPGCNIEPH